MQEAYVSRPKGIPKESFEYEKVKEAFKGDDRKIDCYTKCVDDAWDMRDEKTCASVCEL